MITESETLSWEYMSISVTENNLPSKQADMYAAWNAAFHLRNGRLMWSKKTHLVQKIELENLVGSLIYINYAASAMNE